jgi:hypothetical protein
LVKSPNNAVGLYKPHSQLYKGDSENLHVYENIFTFFIISLCTSRRAFVYRPTHIVYTRGKAHGGGISALDLRILPSGPGCKCRTPRA